MQSVERERYIRRGKKEWKRETDRDGVDRERQIEGNDRERQRERL